MLIRLTDCFTKRNKAVNLKIELYQEITVANDLRVMSGVTRTRTSIVVMWDRPNVGSVKEIGRKARLKWVDAAHVVCGTYGMDDNRLSRRIFCSKVENQRARL